MEATESSLLYGDGTTGTITTQDTTYSLPVASASARGGVNIP
ncbi:hypothetical protein [uncultured Dubosiella sp.]|nr:hypothetical protein [uncultured Dubosiella sp.]